MIYRFTSFHHLFLMLLAVLGVCLPVLATDWPTYMHDNSHSGVTTDNLTLSGLDQQWVYSSLAAPTLAWPVPQTAGNAFPRVKFDDAFYTVGVGSLVYFGSSVDNRIYALNATNGSITWSYYTGGAIRTAPTVSGGYLYASSDDGYIYCLNATTGALVWRYSTMTTQKYMLGNGRMVSECPSRTGVMVNGSNVYFGYGNFRNKGIGMAALAASNGAVVWNNTTAGTNADFSPQGYPVITSTRIIAPSGRMRPSAFLLSDGSYSFTGETPNPDYAHSAAGVNVTLSPDSTKFYVGTSNFRRAYDATTGLRAADFDWTTTEQLISTSTRFYKLVGKDAPTETTPISQVVAYDNYKTLLWSYPSSGELNLCSIILTGNYVIAGANGNVYALDVADGSMDWSHSVNGRAVGLMVANNQLYVSTDTGKVYCFGNGTPVNPTTPSFVEPFNDGNKTKYENAAAAILAETGITKGYVLVTGKGDAAARLGYELAEDQPNLKVHCIVTGDADALSARQALQSALVYGTQVWVDQYQSGSTLLYPDYFANLVVRVQEPGESAPTAAESLRVTKPAHGWLLVGEVLADNNLDPSGADQSTWDAAGNFYSDSSFLAGAGTWYILDRDPLARTGSWTHQNANAGNTGSSEDERVMAPVNALWYGKPGADEAVERHLRSVAPLSHNGKVFHQAYNFATGREYIICYDAYNGTRYWETDITDAYRVNMSSNTGNLACTDEYLFVAAGNQCKRIDVATGSVSATYSLPTGCTGQWGYVAVDGGFLIGSSTTADITVSDYLFARDIATGMSGNPTWTYHNGNFRHNTVTISNGRVFFAETRAGVPASTRCVVALNRSTGASIWEKFIDIANTGGMMLAKNGVLTLGVVCNPYGGASDPNRRVIALAMDDGRLLWDKAVGNKSRPIAVGYRLIAQPSAYHLIDGTQTTFNMSRGSACGAISAAAAALFFRDGVTLWGNAFTGTKAAFFNVRPGCWINMVPAGGVLVQPEASSECSCYYSLQCAMAFKSTASMPTAPSASVSVNGTVHGVINITATASDDSAITAVEFYEDGNPIGVDTSSPYAFSWATAPSGTHAITAIAYDNEGAKTTSSSANVQETNSQPTVSLTEPTDNATFSVGSNITISATASDSDGTISKVEFYQGATLLNTDSVSPYSYVWNSVAVGEYLLTAKAYDDDSVITTSASRLTHVMISNPPTVSITAPVESATFTAPANILITATASDSDGTISKVEFYQGTTKIGEDTTSPYSIYWNNVALGDYALTVIATDNTSVMATSDEVMIHVSDSGGDIAPVVSITAPASGTVEIGTSKTITVNASDADGTISKVEFYAGNTLIAEDTTSPYSYAWTNVCGDFNLTAKAIDNTSAATTSEMVKLTMWNTADIGNVGTTGSASYSNGVFDIYGSGGGITSTADGFRFVYLKVSGDCIIQGRITTWADGGSTYVLGRAGVMVRETLNAGAIEFSSLYRHDSSTRHRAQRNRRTITDGGVGENYMNIADPPYWFKVSRSGNDFTAYYSTNGTAWSAIAAASSVTMASDVYIGLAVTKGDTTATKRAVFDNVSLGNISPTVSITAPADEAQYTAPANITITATASDSDGSVSKVEFYNGTTLLGTDSVSPYSYDWSSVTIGDYSLTAKATDDDLAVTTSTAIDVHVVSSNVSPTVSITSPSGGTVYAPSSNITIDATASDSDGTISKVEFFNGTTEIGEDTTSPYSYTWNSVGSGSYTLTAKATDDDSAETTSSGVNIRVNTFPTVSITDPTDEEQFNSPANISIAASAADSDGTISKVEFYNGTTKLGEDSTSPYSYDWNSVGNGDYTLTAKATDSDSGLTTSTAIDVHVVTGGNNNPPSVTLTAPTNGTIIVGNSYTLTADASDSDGTITKVEFYQGTTKLGEDAISPYSYNWTNITCGVYSMTAKAIDDDSASTDSSAASLTVWNTADIGNVGTAGSSSYNSGTSTFTVTGAGAGITGTADAFRFTYITADGDCEIVAKINTMSSNTNTRGGVMIRETLNAGSKHMSELHRNDTSKRYYTHCRTTTDGTTSTPYVTGGTLPRWVRIVRSGNSFTTYYGTDGSNWTSHTTQSITMNSTVYIGLCMTSTYTTYTCTMTCDNVTVTY